MAENIEVKARLPNYAQAEEVARSLATAGPLRLKQVDTFFQIEKGRLKLREIEQQDEPTNIELIWYERENTATTRKSHYVRAEVGSADSMLELLTQFLPHGKTVRKQRLVYFHHNVRIHLDQVETLGDFVELEGVLPPTATPADEQATAERVEYVAKALNIQTEDRIGVAYVDLLDT